MREIHAFLAEIKDETNAEEVVVYLTKDNSLMVKIVFDYASHDTYALRSAAPFHPEQHDEAMRHELQKLVERIKRERAPSLPE